MRFNLKFFVEIEMVVLILCAVLIVIASIVAYFIGKKNIRLSKISEDTIGYFRYTTSQSKGWLIFKGVFSIILSIGYFIAVPFYVYFVLIPVLKDIPSLLSNNYSYTDGIVDNVQVEKQSNIIFINNLKLYEKKIFSNGKIKQDKEYRIAYLNNTHQCVGFEEIK